MSVQYLSDDNGQITAVQVPIDYWERLKILHPDIGELDADLPQWQTQLLDQRLKAINDDPNTIKPIAGLFEILDRAAK